MLQVNELRYKRFAWCKSFTLESLRESTREGSQFAQKVRRALQDQNQEAILGCMIGSMLCGEMKESSNFAELDAGPWERCPETKAHELAQEIQKKMGCSNSEKALAYFIALEGQYFTLQHDFVYATAVLNDELCCFFFDAG